MLPLLLLIPASGIAQSWILTSAPSNSWRAVAMSADGATLIAAADNSPGDSLIYKSTDSGMSWFPTSAPSVGWRSVASSADGMKIIAAAPNGVYTSADAGATWLLGTNLYFNSVASSADGTQLLGGGNWVWTSTDSGATWAPANEQGAYCVASSADGTTLAFANFAYNGFPLGGIFVSTDGGATWNPSNAPLDASTGWTALAISADKSLVAATIGYTWFPTGPGPIWISLNQGGAWIATSSPRLHWTSIACSADGTKLVAGAYEGLYFSSDSAATWTGATNVPANRRISVACSADGNKLVAAVDGGGIWIWQTTPAPVLNVNATASGVLVSWIVPSTDFVLQESPEVDAPNWTDVPTSPVLILTNLRYEASVSSTNASLYFRLKH